MNQNNTSTLVNIRLFVLRLFTLYLLCYIFFIGDYSNLFHLHFISVELTKFVNRLIIHKEFNGFVPVADFFWHYIACFIFLVLAIINSFLWTIYDQGQRFPFYKYASVLFRYYLGAVMISYGINKLDGLQFITLPSRLIQSVGSTSTFDLFWVLMGASKTYSFFGGLLETTAGFLLLFRRTTTLGCLLAFSALLNVFLLDISYGPDLKLMVFHLLLPCLFLLLPDLKRIYKFFVLRQVTSLSNPETAVIASKKFSWIQLLLKFCLIGYIFYTNVKADMDLYDKINHLPYQNLVGIHEIKGFHSSNPGGSTDSLQWKQIAIDPFDAVKIQWKNDSVAYFSLKADTLNKTLELNSWTNTASRVILHYGESKGDEWIFQGLYKTDSIRFLSKKIEVNTLPLLKDRGKIKWWIF